jgi:hypothetical protein
MKKESLIIIHTILIILVWTSPFWLDWKLILVCILLLSIQYIIFKGCALTNLQFSNKINKKVEDTMYSYYLEKIGFKPNKRRIKFLARYIFPIIILGLALIWQIILNMQIIIRI